MSDLSPASDLEGHEGEEAAKAASENQTRTREEQSAADDSDAESGAEAPAKAEKEDAPKAKRRGARKKVKSAPHVIGTADTDTVVLSALVFKNEHARKSLSVHHLQRRLAELGYGEAGADRDGYFGDLTRAAVAKFQEDEELDSRTGLVDRETLEEIFDGDDNVTLSFA